MLSIINSSPASGITDPRPAYAVYENFGLVDTWNLRIDGPPSDGLTCCQSETLDNEESEFYERIDVVLADFGDFAPYNVRSVVMGGTDRAKTASGTWPSDHGGVAVRLKLTK